MSGTFVTAIWVWCRTCGARGMVNSKLGVRGTIEKCSACQRDGRGGQDANPTPTAGTKRPRRSSG